MRPPWSRAPGGAGCPRPTAPRCASLARTARPRHPGRCVRGAPVPRLAPHPATRPLDPPGDRRSAGDPVAPAVASGRGARPALPVLRQRGGMAGSCLRSVRRGPRASWRRARAMLARGGAGAAGSRGGKRPPGGGRPGHGRTGRRSGGLARLAGGSTARAAGRRGDRGPAGAVGRAGTGDRRAAGAVLRGWRGRRHERDPASA